LAVAVVQDRIYHLAAQVAEALAEAVAVVLTTEDLNNRQTFHYYTVAVAANQLILDKQE
jgi:hypothetical protein